MRKNKKYKIIPMVKNDEKVANLINHHRKINLEIQLPEAEFEKIVKNSKNQIFWIGKEQKSKLNLLNFYYYQKNDFSDINAKINEITIREGMLKEKGFKVEGIKSFNRNTWLDLSRESNAMEGIFKDFSGDLRDFRIKLKGKFSVSDPDTMNFDYEEYFHLLRNRELDVNKRNDSAILLHDPDSMSIEGKTKKHKISIETVRHYIAFKYAYKCAKQYRYKDLKASDYSRIIQNCASLLAGNEEIEIVPFRKIQVYVNKNENYDIAKWTPVKPTVIYDKFQTLCEWLSSCNNINPIEKAAIAQAEFIRIHPYFDGNGRTSRILSNFILMLGGFPTVTIRNKYTLTYFNALNTAIETHNCDDLINIFKESMKDSIREIDNCLDFIEKSKVKKTNKTEKSNVKTKAKHKEN